MDSSTNISNSKSKGKYITLNEEWKPLCVKQNWDMPTNNVLVLTC